MVNKKVKIIWVIIVIILLYAAVHVVTVPPVRGEVIESDDWKIEFELIDDGLTRKEFEIRVQNLSNTKQDLILDLLFHETNFNIAQLENLEFFEWKVVDTDVQVPDYEVAYYEISIVDEDNNIIGYKYEPYSKLTGYHIQVMKVNSWKSAKQQYFNLTDKELRINIEKINVPRFESKPKYDDQESIETENGTKVFRLRFDVPLVETKRGWGSLGLVNVVVDNVIYGSEYVGESGSTWWSNDWGYRKAITIDNTKVENENFTNFPVLISWGADSDLAVDAMDNGDDIAFADSAHSQIDHEIENFVGDNGQLIAWVEIPTLYDNDNTIIYMYYGNASAANQENPSGTWDANFLAVWHMDGMGVTISDSKSSNDGTKKAAGEPQEVGGKIGRGQDFGYDASQDDYIDMGDVLNITTGPVTFELWMKSTQTGADSIIIGKNAASRPTYELYFYTGGGGKVRVYLLPASGTFYAESGESASDGSWDYICGVRDGSSLYVYQNGIQYSDTGTALTLSSSGKFVLGSNRDFVQSYDGILDEVRMSNVQRSANWILTAFRGMDDPSSFFAVGAEETPPPPVTPATPLLLHRVALVWVENETLENYDVQIDDDSDFSSLIVQENELTDNIYVYNFADNGVYYWRVRAKNADGDSAWSATQTIWVDTPHTPATSAVDTSLAVIGIAIAVVAVAVAAKRYKKRIK